MSFEPGNILTPRLNRESRYQLYRHDGYIYVGNRDHQLFEFIDGVTASEMDTMINNESREVDAIIRNNIRQNSSSSNVQRYTGMGLSSSRKSSMKSGGRTCGSGGSFSNQTLSKYGRLTDSIDGLQTGVETSLRPLPPFGFASNVSGYGASSMKSSVSSRPRTVGRGRRLTIKAPKSSSSSQSSKYV